MLSEYLSSGGQNREQRGLSVTPQSPMNQQAVAMDPFLVNEIEEAIRQTR